LSEGTTSSILVASILKSFNDRPPVDDREAISRERFRTDLARLVDPCDEEADKTHLTASVMLVGPKGLCLHRHKRLGIWLQPGGHIDQGETAPDAAVREALEETGMRAVHYEGVPRLIHVDAHDAPRGHFHLDLRYVLWADEEPSPPEGESQEVRWYPWDEALTVAEPGLAGIISALTTFVLRPASPDRHAAAVAEVYLRSFRSAYPNEIVKLAHTDDEVRAWVREFLLEEHECFVAVTPAGLVVGFVAVSDGRLDQLYVDPAWQRRGIGTALFNAAKRALPDGFDLWTFQVNERGRMFYETRGMTAVEFGDGTENEEGVPDVRYEWAGQ
jgi:8-oxo-dGTP pyrophosphatase MutT (NUDIX family)/N-acetylglutamate synthase-like GNAT family acetyltransferase